MSFRPGQAKGPSVSISGGGGGGAPVNATYVVMSLDGTLTQERVLTQGTGGITIVDSGANAPVTINNTLTGANVGVGTGLIFKNKTSAPDVLNLKSLIAGTNVSLTNGTDDITIDVPGAPLSQTPAHGEASFGSNATTTALTVQNTWYDISPTTWVAGLNRSFSVNTTTGLLTCGQEGMYAVFAAISNILVAGQDFEYAVFHNGSLISKSLKTGSYSATSDVTPICLLYLEVGDTIQVKVRCTSAASQSITVVNILFMAHSLNTALDGIDIATFRDDFMIDRPYWYGTAAITSGLWTRTTGVGGYMLLSGTSPTTAEYRKSLEGDIDHRIRFWQGAEQNEKTGFQLVGNSNTARLVFDWVNNDVIASMTGESDVTIALDTPVDTYYWGRIVRVGQRVAFYYRRDDSDVWILIASYTDKELGADVTASLLSLDSTYNDAVVDRFILYDSMYSHLIRATGVREIPLTDAATIAVDASKGNLFKVTLTANRQLGNPTNPAPNQKIIIRVKQDGTGSRVLTYDTKYRFSTDLPSPTLSTTASATDYLGFIYNDTDDKWDFIAIVKGF